MLASAVHVAEVPVGRPHFTLIAGPCAIETPARTLETAIAVRARGASLLRAGAFKPRSSPRSFQGLGERGLEILLEVKELTGMPVVTELTDIRHVERVHEVADLIQVGSRNMHNSALLTELGRTDRPVLLKRGLSATVDELLAAAEYVLCEGNERVILCERGIRTFETGYRFTLDLGAVAVLRERTHLPVIVDPSHAAGRRELVLPLSLAAVAVGADGLIVEVHPDPASALCDGPQALTTAEFGGYAEQVWRVAEVMGRRVPFGDSARGGASTSARTTVLSGEAR